jgi:hypothetical protein
MKISTLFASLAFAVSFCSAAFASQCLNPSTIQKVLAPVYQHEGGFMAAAWEDVDNIPQLRRCGLALGPNDLRYVRTFSELVGVVEWGLNNARVCQPCE